MAFFRSVRTLISGTTRNSKLSSSSSRSFLGLSFSSTLPVIHSPPPSNPFLSHPHFLSRCKCPLFLSSPPWKLSQSATPLLLQSDVIFVGFSFPYNLRVKLVSSPQKSRNESKDKEFSDSQAAVRAKYNFLNFPNLISFSRLLSGPLLGWMIIHDMYLPAFVGLAISGATDWLDGYVARKMSIDSVVGSYLDPLADKVLIGFVALAMVDKGLLHAGLVSLVVLRDIGLVGGAVYKRGSDLEWKWKSWVDFFNLDGTCRRKVEPLLLSKVNTVFQLVLVAGALLQPEFGNEETQSYITYLSWLVALTTAASTVAYGAQHMKAGSPSIRS